MAEFDEGSATYTGPDGKPIQEFDEASAEILPPPSSIARRVLGDTAVSAAKGVIGAGEAVVGLADIPTLGAAGKALENKPSKEPAPTGSGVPIPADWDGKLTLADKLGRLSDLGWDPKSAKKMLDEGYSPEQRAANAEVQSAKGFLPTIASALQNPSVIAQAAVESAPSMFGGGAIGRGVRALAPKAAPLVAGAIGEGAVGAGMAAEQVRQETDDGMLTPKQAGLAAATGVVTGAITRLAGGVANKLGISDVDILLAGGGAKGANKGLIRRVAEGIISEGALEELPQSAQEQILQNIALDKPWDQGVAEAAAMGALTGGLIGGGVNVFTGKAPEAAPPAPAPEQTIAGLLPAPGQTSVPQIDGEAGAFPLTMQLDRQRRADEADANAASIYAARAAEEARVEQLRRENPITAAAGLLPPPGSPLGNIMLPNDAGPDPTIKQGGEQAAVDNAASIYAARAAREEELARFAANGTLSAAAATSMGQGVTQQVQQTRQAEVEGTLNPKAAAGIPEAVSEAEKESQQAVAEHLSRAKPLSLEEAQAKVQHAFGRQSIMVVPLEGGGYTTMAATKLSKRQQQAIKSLQEPAKDVQDEPVLKQMPIATPEAAKARAAARTAETGVEFTVVQHPLANGKYAIARAPRTIEGESQRVQEAPAEQPRDKYAGRPELRPVDGRLQRIEPITPEQSQAIVGGTNGTQEAPPTQRPSEALAGNPADVAGPPEAAAGPVAAAEAAPQAEGVAPAPVAAQDDGDAEATQQIATLVRDAATSPENDRAHPTAGQAGAGNYKKARLPRSLLGGLPVTIENPGGSIRVAKDGSWASRVTDHYGYVRAEGNENAKGNDADEVDISIGPNPTTGKVFVVDQNGPDGKFDEHKIRYGYPDIAAAEAAYRADYPADHQGFAGITETTVEELKAWLKDGVKSLPFAKRDTPGNSRNAVASSASGFRSTSLDFAVRPPTQDDPKSMPEMKHLFGEPDMFVVDTQNGKRADPLEERAIAALVKEALRLGLPPSALTGLKPIFVTPGTKTGLYNYDTASIGLSRDDLRLGADGDKAASMNNVGKLLHEVAHHVSGDADGASYAAASPAFAIKTAADGSRTPQGAIMREAFERWATGNEELALFLDYPFSDWSKNKGNATATLVLQDEVFAQLYRLYYSNPRLLRMEFPKAFALMEEIHNEVDRATGQGSRSLTIGETRAAVQRALRARPNAGGLLDAPRGAGATDDRSAGVREAGAGVGQRDARGEALRESDRQQGTGTDGGRGRGDARLAAASAAGSAQAQRLTGTPGDYEPSARAQQTAREYMKAAGLPYNPPTEYVRVDPARAARIAQAYADMKHEPGSLPVKAAYATMIRETLAQWKAIEKTGLKVEFAVNGKAYPYTVPGEVFADVNDNNHMWVFPTLDGFGSDASVDVSDNPLLADTGIVIGGHKLVANDVFRIVHDYFGHIKNGVGFRANGEENAWRAHAAMFSPLARKAMTSETRGQNSWLNFGPHGEANRKAKTEDTVFADQKSGLLPDEFIEDNYAKRPAKLEVRDDRRGLRDVAKAKDAPGSDVGHKREASGGRYVGAPDWVGSSPMKLAHLRKKLRQLASEGEVGRYWYEQSSRAILKFVGGNKAEAEKLVALIAIYSPNNAVPGNTTAALLAWYQYKAGVPIRVAMAAADKKANALMYDGNMWSGVKTNSFYQNLMVEIDPSKLDPGVATMDMWMALAYDYGSKSVDQGPQYKFMEAETRRLADELGWDAHQVQAAIWTAMKGRVDPIRGKLKERELATGIGEMYEDNGKQKYRVIKGHEYDHFRLAHKMGMDWAPAPNHFSDAAYDFSNALQERSAQMSWEARPSADVDKFPELFTAPIEQQAEYMAAIDAAMRDENGRDLIAEKLGILAAPTAIGPSAWEGEVGMGGQVQAPIAQQAGLGGPKRMVDDRARLAFDLWSAVRGLALKQDGVYWHMPVFEANKADQNGLQITFPKALSVDDTRTLYNAIIAEAGHQKWAPAVNGNVVRILNFEDTPSKEFRAKITAALGALPDNFEGWELAGFRSDGSAITNDWKEQKNGEGYRQRLSAAGRSDVLGWADTALADAIKRVDEAFAAKYGWTLGAQGAAGQAEGVAAKRPQALEVRDDSPLWYSQLATAVESKAPFAKDGTVPAGQLRMWLAARAKDGAVKSEELKWSGLDDYLATQQGRVSRDSVTAFLNQNGVRVEESVLGEVQAPAGWSMSQPGGPDGRWKFEGRGIKAYGDTPQDAVIEAKLSIERAAQAFQRAGKAERAKLAFDNADELDVYIEALAGKGGAADAKFASYQLPGGENYRELLLTLPANPDLDPKPGYRVFDKAGVEQVDTLRREVADDTLAEYPGGRIEEYTRHVKDMSKNFRSSHFDQPNILAHIRFNERVDAEGKRVLFIEEIQSDWAQKGRKEGFGDTSEPRFQVIRGNVFHSITYETRPEAEDQARILNKSEGPGWTVREHRTPSISVPAAPFVQKTEAWVALAMKRMIRYAVDNGFERVAWTTGEQQAARYDLSKHIDEVSVTRHADGLYTIYAKHKGQPRRDVVAGNTDLGKLEDYVGKELAEKIRSHYADQRNPSKDVRYSGLDLKVGGEGMRAFYDKIVPNVANDLLKKVGGGRVGEVGISQGGKDLNPWKLRDATDDGEGAVEQEFANRASAENWANEHGGVKISYEPGGITPQPGFDLPPQMLGAAKRPQALFVNSAPLDAVTNGVRDLLTTQKSFNLWDRTVGTQLHKALKNPMFKKVYDGVQSFLNDSSQLMMQAADLAPDLLPKLDGLKDVLKRGASKQDLERVSSAIFEGTLNDRVYTSAELAQKGLNGKQIGLYQQARKAIDKSLADVFTSEAVKQAKGLLPQSVLDQAKADGDFWAVVNGLSSLPTRSPVQQQVYDQLRERAAEISDLQSKGYAPLQRFGRYTVHVANPDGSSALFTMHESEREANAFARAVRGTLTPGQTLAQGVMSQEAWKLYQGVSPDTLEVFAQAIGASQDEVMQKYIKLAANNRSVLKRMLQRKEIAGFQTDVQRTLAQFITSNARAASKNYHWGPILKAQQELNNDKAHGDVADEAQRLTTYVQNTEEEAGALRGLLFIQFLGGSIASAFTNATQPVMMTFPWLAQHGGAVNAAAQIAKAGKIAAGSTMMEPALKAAMDRATKEGIVAPHEVHGLYAESIRNFGSNMTVRKGLKIWGSLFSLAEAFNRRITFVAAYRTAVAQNMPDPYEFAIRAIAETQGVYNKGNRPNWARGAVGATLFTFKQYSVAYVELLARLPKKEKAIMLAMLVLASGLQGLPGADDLEDVIDTIAESLGYSFNSKKQLRQWAVSTLGDTAGGMLTHGFSAMPGVPLDVQARLGLGNLFPGTAILKRSEPDKSRDVLEFFGPAGSQAKSVLDAFSAAQEGDRAALARSVVPVAVRNALMGMDMAQSGFYKDTKGRRVIDTDAYDAAIKSVGFQPSVVARQSRIVQDLQQDIGLAKDVEGKIVERMAKAITEHDPEAMQKARVELFTWNQTNPTSPIRVMPSQVQQRVRQILMTREQRFVRTASREMRGSVMEALRQ